MDRPLPVSLCIIAFNEERQIADCLESALGWAAEIVVLDAESQDRTAELIKRFQKDHSEIRLLSAPNLENFDINKTKTFEAASQPWIFYLDADERMTPALWEEIGEAVRSDRFAGYLVGRKNYYFGRWMRYGGMYPEKQPRLFQRGKGRLPMRRLHETVQIDGEVGELQETFLHYAYATVSQHLVKLDKYTTAQAHGWQADGVGWTAANHLKYGLVRPLGRFVQKYIAMAGFRDGFIGFYVAFMTAVGELVAYMKVHERS